MAKKFASKALKVTSMSMGLMIGTMVAGAGLATAGWWFTDRLDMNFKLGEAIDINEVRGAGGNCKEGSKGTNTYTDKDGNIFVQEMECVSNDNGTLDGIKIKEVKTASGVRYEYKYDVKKKMDYTFTGDGKKKPKVLTPTLVAQTFQGPTFWQIGKEQSTGVDQKVKAQKEKAAKEKAAQEKAAREKAAKQKAAEEKRK